MRRPPKGAGDTTHVLVSPRGMAAHSTLCLPLCPAMCLAVVAQSANARGGQVLAEHFGVNPIHADQGMYGLPHLHGR